MFGVILFIFKAKIVPIKVHDWICAKVAILHVNIIRIVLIVCFYFGVPLILDFSRYTECEDVVGEGNFPLKLCSTKIFGYAIDIN